MGGVWIEHFGGVAIGAPARPGCLLVSVENDRPGLGEPSTKIDDFLRSDLLPVDEHRPTVEVYEDLEFHDAAGASGGSGFASSSAFDFAG